VRYDVRTGEFVDVDFAFNAEGFDFDMNDGPETDPDAPEPTSADSLYKDFLNVWIHELGHGGGIADIYNPGYGGYYLRQMGFENQMLTMYGLIKSAENHKRSLEDDDKLAVQWIYDNVPESAISIVLVYDGSTTYTTTLSAFDASKLSGTELVTNLRIGDALGVVQLPGTVVAPLTVIQGEAERTALIDAISTMTPMALTISERGSWRVRPCYLRPKKRASRP